MILDNTYPTIIMKTCSVNLFAVLLYSGFIYNIQAESFVSRHVRKADTRSVDDRSLTTSRINTPLYLECVCGNGFGNDERIVGGYSTLPHQFPWQVGLTEHYERPYCGGILINDLYVLTAAHCIVDFRPQQVMVLLAEHDADNDADRAFRVPATKLIPHPQYNDKRKQISYDIGLVKMASRIPFSEVTLPPCFPPPGLEYAHELALVTGWGRIKDGGKPSTVLRAVEVPVIPLDECMARYQGEYLILDSMICAAWPQGKKDACSGDSGGPLIWKNDRRWYLIGIVSWGIGCALPNHPAAYTRVDKFYQWIDQHTQDAVTCVD